LKVLLDDPEGLAGSLINRAPAANSRATLAATEGALKKLPKVSGSWTGQVYLSMERGHRVLARQSSALRILAFVPASPARYGSHACPNKVS
jgi:ATP-dependent Clp protease ATP-binding subunit ClpB